MLVVFPFHAGDKDQAIRLATWIKDLGGVKNHKCLLVVAATTDATGVIEPLREAFDSAEIAFRLDEEVEHPEWPHSQNYMWVSFAMWIARQKDHFAPWLWLEPDAAPLVPEWLDKIEEAYKACGMPIMGDFVKVDDVSIHISGVAVYPGNVGQCTNKLWEIHPLGVPLNKRAPAWDMALREDFFPFAANTNLIHHCFWQHKRPDIAPEFPTIESLRFIESEAVLFHRCKSESLIQRLIEWRSFNQISVSRNGEQREAATGITSPHETLGNRINQPGGAGESPAEFIRSRSVKEHPESPGAEEQKRTIFTYYAEVPQIKRVDEFQLIYLWKEEWRKAGWDPHVLTERDAEKHPLYEQAKAIFSRFPSQNPEGYDLTCFMRHLAFSMVAPAFFSDYDVLPLQPSFDFEHLHDVDFFSGNERDPKIPCFLHATKAGIEDMIFHFMTCERPTISTHISDMVLLRSYIGGKGVTVISPSTHLTVLEYSEPGWQQAKAVHFPTARMQPAGLMPKWKHIPKLLAEARMKKVSDLMDRIPTPNGFGVRASDTIIGQIRDHLSSISSLIDGKHHRRQLFHDELRKAGLFGQPRKSNGPKRRNSNSANQAAARKHQVSA